MMGNSLLRFPRAASHWCLQVSLLIGFICVLSFRISCYPALIQPLPCGPAFVTSLSDTKNYLLEYHCPIPVPCWPSRRKWRGRADRKLSVKGKGNCRHFCQKICKMQCNYNCTFRNHLSTYPALFHRLWQASVLSPALTWDCNTQRKPVGLSVLGRLEQGQKPGGQGWHNKSQASRREAEQSYSACLLWHGNSENSGGNIMVLLLTEEGSHREMWLDKTSDPVVPDWGNKPVWTLCLASA